MVSIIVPSYNNLELLKNCILSIQDQTFKDYEVWIIDNESTDGTTEFLKTLRTPFHWISEKDSGIYDAMNKGILLAKKEWIYFLGADDKFYNENVLKSIFSKSISEENKLILGNIRYDLKKGDRVYINNRHGLVKPSWSLKLWIKNSVHHQGIFYKRDLFSERRYELKYKVLADYAFNLYLYTKKVKVKICDNVFSLCGARGLSKKYNYSLYREEVKLKVDNSSILLKPIFFIISLTKYSIKKI